MGFPRKFGGIFGGNSSSSSSTSSDEMSSFISSRDLIEFITHYGYFIHYARIRYRCTYNFKEAVLSVAGGLLATSIT